MGATKIMVIRHAEKPGSYNGVQYVGVNNLGTLADDDGAKHLVTLGWKRAGALVTLFAAPWGPKTLSLATPQFLFASDPIAKHDDGISDEGPSQRPHETLTALAAKLTLSIDTSYGKNHYAKMVKSALACEGVVLIAWQNEDIALTGEDGRPGDQPGNPGADRNNWDVQYPNELADWSGWRALRSGVRVRSAERQRADHRFHISYPAIAGGRPFVTSEVAQYPLPLPWFWGQMAFDQLPIVAASGTLNGRTLDRPGLHSTRDAR
jgi:hypothetical protein